MTCVIVAALRAAWTSGESPPSPPHAFSSQRARRKTKDVLTARGKKTLPYKGNKILDERA